MKSYRRALKKKVYDNLENIKSYVNDSFKIDKTKTLLIYAGRMDFGKYSNSQLY
jgi:hypothetical protein